MKYLVLLIALITLASIEAEAYYERITVNGGENGYYSTSKRIYDDNDTYIRCEDPGYSSCPTVAYNPEEDILADYALSEISSGILSGTFYDVDKDLTVTWTSDSPDGYNSTIVVE